MKTNVLQVVYLNVNLPLQPSVSKSTFSLQYQHEISWSVARIWNCSSISNSLRCSAEFSQRKIIFNDSSLGDNFRSERRSIVGVLFLGFQEIAIRRYRDADCSIIFCFSKKKQSKFCVNS